MAYYKHPKFKTPDDLIEMLEGFKDYAEESKEYVSAFLLADYLGMSEPTFWRYRREKGYEQYHEIMAQALTKLGIKDMTKLDQTGSKAAEISLKRIHKLTETQVIEQTNTNLEMTDEEKAERLKRLKSG